MALGVGREGGLAGQGCGGADGGAGGGPLGGHGGGHLALGHQAALVAGVRHQLALRGQCVRTSCTWPSKDRHSTGQFCGLYGQRACVLHLLTRCIVPVFYTWIHAVLYLYSTPGYKLYSTTGYAL